MNATKNNEAGLSKPAETEAQTKLKIHFAPADVGGTSFHWCKLPAKCINDSGLADATVERKFDFDADILVIQRQVFPKIIPALKEFQKRGGAVVYWLEDQVFLLPMTSPVWKEYVNKTCQGIGEIVQVCDGVTCSSTPLGRYLSQWNKNIHVLPHMMLKKWGKIYQPPTKRKDKDIRILWTTTAHHRHDFPIVEHALKDICNKHKNVKVIIWGFITPRMVEIVPKDQLEYYGWVPIDEYYKCLTAMEADIGICPLETPNIYNDAKTPLKFLEYGLMKYAPVVSPAVPYMETVKDGETGVIVARNKHKYWVEALDKVVSDAKLRKTIAQNAHDFVIENHTEDRIADYIAIYKEILDGKKQKEAPKGTEKQDNKEEGVRE